jgi:anaerobic magnesium-protoporphyrin IX monomethyl ester cyclase
MRCLLLVPAWEVAEIYSPGTAGSQVSFQHPDGILSVAAYLKAQGHTLRVLDGAFRDHEDILAEVERFAPDWVGIYANTPLWNKAQNTAKDIRAKMPEVFISVGGPCPIAYRARCLEECEHLDAVDIGEGELTSAELMERLEKKQDLKGLHGIVYRDRATRQIVVNPPRALIKNLDILPPPAIELLDFRERYVSPPGTYRRTPIINVHSSRGCINDCTFCFQLGANVDPKYARTMRYRSPEHVVDEIESRVKEFGYKEVRFLDDMFIVDHKRVRRICQLIKERNIDVTWYCSSRVDIVTPDILKEMRSAGCWAILYGVESGVQKNLDMLRKRTTLDQIRAAVRWAKEAGIKVYTPFIFGIPGETFEEGLQSIDFAIELDPYIANFNTLTPLPGTDLYEQVQREGTWESDTDHATFQHAAYVPSTMTKAQLIQLRSIAFKRFYGRPKYVVRRLLDIRTKSDVRALLSGAQSMAHIFLNKNIFNPDLFMKAPGDH